MHAFYNIDIFQKLQTDITYFKEKGKIFLCGDFNSRTSNKADYVENDRILGFQDDTEYSFAALFNGPRIESVW